MPRHATQLGQRRRLPSGDPDQLLVVEHHVGGHAVLPGHRGPPGPQRRLAGSADRRRWRPRGSAVARSGTGRRRPDLAAGAPRTRRAGGVTWGAVPSSSARNGEGAVGVGQDHELGAGPGEGDVEDPSLALDVVAQAVREQSGGDADHQHVPPLLPLDPVDGRQFDRRTGGGGPAQDLAEPVGEGGRVRVEHGDRLQRGQVVGVGRPVRTGPGGVQRVQGVVQADPLPHGPQGGGRRPRGRRRHGVEVVGVGEQLGHVPPGQPAGQAADVGDRGRPLPGEHVHDHGRDPP